MYGLAQSAFASDDGSPVEKTAEVRNVFTCRIYRPGWKTGVRIVETAEDYAALRKEIVEITFPTPGVRRTGSKMLRELGKFDFKRNRLVLISNTSMADEIRVETADTKEIRVRNVSTLANAIEDSATLIAVPIARGPQRPRVSWVGGAPTARRLGPLKLPPEKKFKRSG